MLCDILRYDSVGRTGDPAPQAGSRRRRRARRARHRVAPPGTVGRRHAGPMAAGAGVHLLRRAGRPRADSRRAQHLGRWRHPAPPARAAAGAVRSPRAPTRASAAGPTRAARNAATARGRGRSRPARSRRGDRFARRRPLTRGARPVAADTHRHLDGGRDDRGPRCRAGARIQPSDGRCPSATGWRALAAPHARAGTRRSEWARRSAPGTRVADCSAGRKRVELKRLVSAFRRAELEWQPRPTEELTHGCARVVGHRSEPVRAGRPRVLSQPGTDVANSGSSAARWRLDVVRMRSFTDTPAPHSGRTTVLGHLDVTQRVSAAT